MQKALGFVKRHPISILFAGVTVFLMAFIYSFSAEASAESNATSAGVCYFISTIFVKGFTDLPLSLQEARIQELVPIVRKIAHLSIYAALGFFAYLTQSAFVLELKRNVKKGKTAVCATAFSLLYAISDEVHQLFVEGRNGNAIDVFIDLSGALVGVVFAFVIILLFAKWQTKRCQKNKIL